MRGNDNRGPGDGGYKTILSLVPREFFMSSNKPWTPDIDGQSLLHPFGAPEGGINRGVVKLRDPEQDSAPLQGTRDLSDADSLEDVRADAEEKQHGSGE